MPPGLPLGMLSKGLRPLGLPLGLPPEAALLLLPLLLPQGQR